jgi:hypothetical protein
MSTFYFLVGVIMVMVIWVHLHGKIYRGVYTCGTHLIIYNFAMKMEKEWEPVVCALASA